MKKIVFLSVFILGLITTWLAKNLESVTERIILDTLRSREIRNLSFKIKKINLSDIIIEDVKWNQYCLEINQIHLSFSLTDLIKKKYGQLLVDEIHSCYHHPQASIDQSPSSNLAIPSSLPPKIYPILSALNFDRIEIKKLLNNAQFDNMEVTTTSNLIFTSEGDAKKIVIHARFGQKQLNFSLSAQGYFTKEDEKIYIDKLVLQLPNSNFFKTQNIFYHRSSNQPDLCKIKVDHLEDGPFKFEQIKLSFDQRSLSTLSRGKLEVLGIENPKLGFKNFNLVSSFELTKEKLDTNLNITTPKSLFNLNLKGNYFFSSSRGEFFITLPRTVIKDKEKLKEVYSKIPEELKSLTLNLALNGKMNIYKNLIKPNLSLKITDASFYYTNQSVSNLTGNFKLTSISPVKIFADIQIPSIEKPVPLTHLKSQITLNDKLLKIHNLHFKIWDGFVQTPGTTYSLTRKFFTPTLIKFEGVSLNQIFNFLNKPNLKGDGIIDGELPLTFSGIIPLINNGHIYSKAKGNLRLRLDQGAKQAMVRNQHVNILADFLENLNYERISLDFSTNEKLDLKSQLTVLGNNPELKDKYQRRPLEFKMTLNFNIVKMLTSQGASLELPEKIERMILKNGK